MSQLIMKLLRQRPFLHLLTAVVTAATMVILICGFIQLREVNDPDSSVFWIKKYKKGAREERAMAISVLSARRPYTDAVKAVLAEATRDEDDVIRFMSIQSLSNNTRVVCTCSMGIAPGCTCSDHAIGRDCAHEQSDGK